MQQINKADLTLKMFCMAFFFKSFEYMDVTCVIQLFYYEHMYYEHMKQILYSKPSPFCCNKPSLYPQNVILVILKPIFLRSGVFPNEDNDLSLSISFVHGAQRLIIRSSICPYHLWSVAWSTSLCTCNAMFSY